MFYLSKYDKSLIVPQIIFTSEDRYGGGYYHPGKYEVERDGCFYDARNGIIEVSTLWPDIIPATIIHEWRHHWQFFNHGPAPEWPWITPDNWEDYDQAIKRYFSAWHEFDALQFENKYEPNDVNDHWIGLIDPNRIWNIKS